MAKKDAAKGTATDETSAPAAQLDEAASGGATTALATTSHDRNGVAAAPSRQVAGYEVGDIGTGFEDFTSVDLAVPFVAILQKGSPQVEEDNPKYVKGAKPGMLMNTVTQELYDGKAGIRFIPVHRVRSYIEWIPKDDGGGLVNVYEPNAQPVLAALAKHKKETGKTFGKVKIADNNDLVETFNVYGLIVKPDGSTQNVVLSMASSQIPMYKKWMTTAQSIKVPGADGNMVTPPMFSHVYRLTTLFHQKKEYTWYKWNAQLDGANHEACKLEDSDPLCQEAKQFRALLLSGAAQANFSSLQQEEIPDAEYDM